MHPNFPPNPNNTTQPSSYAARLFHNQQQERRATRQALLTPVPEAHISKRPGPGGHLVRYIEGNYIIDATNHVFNFDGWMSQIVHMAEDFFDYDGSMYTCGIFVILRVIHRSGAFREDIGYGGGKNASKAECLEKARKEAVTDAFKRCVRLFGPRLGGSVQGNQSRNQALDAEFQNIHNNVTDHHHPQTDPQTNLSIKSHHANPQLQQKDIGPNQELQEMEKRMRMMEDMLKSVQHENFRLRSELADSVVAIQEIKKSFQSTQHEPVISAEINSTSFPLPSSLPLTSLPHSNNPGGNQTIGLLHQSPEVVDQARTVQQNSFTEQQRLVQQQTLRDQRLQQHEDEHGSNYQHENRQNSDHSHSINNTAMNDQITTSTTPSRQSTPQKPIQPTQHLQQQQQQQQQPQQTTPVTPTPTNSTTTNVVSAPPPTTTPVPQPTTNAPPKFVYGKKMVKPVTKPPTAVASQTQTIPQPLPTPAVPTPTPSSAPNPLPQQNLNHPASDLGSTPVVKPAHESHQPQQEQQQQHQIQQPQVSNQQINQPVRVQEHPFFSSQSLEDDFFDGE